MAYIFLRKALKFVFFAGVIVVSILALIGLYWASGADIWEKQGKILQDDQPYGGGLLMIRDGKYLILKISRVLNKE